MFCMHLFLFCFLDCYVVVLLVCFSPSFSFERDEADSSKHVKMYVAIMTMLVCDLQFTTALAVDF